MMLAVLLSVALMTPQMIESREAWAHQQRLDTLAAINGPYVEREEVRHDHGRTSRVSPPSVTTPPSVETWRPLVEAYFDPADVPWAMRVMACESGGNPLAYNPSTASGLFQIKTFWLTELGPGDLFDPEFNVASAAYIFYRYGAHHWVCS